MATTSEPPEPGLWNMIWMWAHHTYANTTCTPVKCCLQSIITNMDTTRHFEVISEKNNDIIFTESVRYFNRLLKRIELHKNNKNAYMGSRSSALFVFNLKVRCRWVFSFTPRPLYRRLKTLRMGPAAGVGGLGTRNISCLCPYLTFWSWNFTFKF